MLDKVVLIYTTFWHLQTPSRTNNFLICLCYNRTNEVIYYVEKNC